MAGRKTMGPSLVSHLDGSSHAKDKLELILSTLSGSITVVEASRQLGICEAMFYRLRNRALQMAVDDLEPKPTGRPPDTDTPMAQENAELKETVNRLQQELDTRKIQLELSQTMPQIVRSSGTVSEKKTTSRNKNRMSSKPKRK